MSRSLLIGADVATGPPTKARSQMLRSVGTRLRLNDKLRRWLGIEIRLYGDMRADLELLVGRGALVVVDIGANIGQSADVFSRSFPCATIYAFEPFAASYDIMVSRGIPRVDARQSAIGAADGVAELFLNAASATNSLLVANDDGRRLFPDQTRPIAVTKVDVTRLDTFVAAENLDKIDLLKIDVQGAELDVFAGGRDALQRTHALLVECNFISTYEGSSLFGSVDSVLREHGFEYYNFYGLHQDPQSRRFVFGDALYLRRQ